MAGSLKQPKKVRTRIYDVQGLLEALEGVHPDTPIHPISNKKMLTLTEWDDRVEISSHTKSRSEFVRDLTTYMQNRFADGLLGKFDISQVKSLVAGDRTLDVESKEEIDRMSDDQIRQMIVTPR